MPERDDIEEYIERAFALWFAFLRAGIPVTEWPN